jgi:hypothetical protein
MKTISQNPERYFKQGANWVISATSEITPITLPIGVPLQNLKPLILANGIIVKVGGDYLCSLTTLNSIKESNNPHYDIVENGKLMVKDMEVTIGKTIKIIELDISRLESIGELQDTKGIKAGVSSVDYIYEGNKTDGVSNNLITQINYTLNKDSIRGLDTYTLYQLKLAPDSAYSLSALETVKQPQNELLDLSKLKVFTEGVRERLTLLRADFNMIKKTFFEGIIPINLGKVEITANSLSDPAQQLLGAKDLHQVIYKEVGAVQNYRDRDSIQRGIIAKIQSQGEEIAKQNQDVQSRIESAQSEDASIQSNLAQRIEELQNAIAKKKDK